MKVYVVETYDFEETAVQGVFSTKEKAEQAIKEWKKKDALDEVEWEYDITSLVLDKY